LFKSKGNYKVFSAGGDSGGSSFNTSGFKGVDGLMSGVKEGKDLKKTTTVDKSTPKIDNVTIKKVDRQGFLSEVQTGTGLKEVTGVHDTSGPKIPAIVVLGDHDHLMKEVESDHSLKHPEQIHDASKPVIDSGVQIKKVDRKEILKQGIVENPPKLRDVEDFVNDRSEPNLEGTEVKNVNSRKVLFQEIKTEETKILKKPEAVADRSAPVVVKKTDVQKCCKCDKSVYSLELLVACDKNWHKSCFRCKHCNSVLGLKGFATIDGEPYCKPHYLEIFKSKGTYKAFSGKEGASTSFNTTFKGVH
jgi:hypothetical protein